MGPSVVLAVKVRVRAVVLKVVLKVDLNQDHKVVAWEEVKVRKVVTKTVAVVPTLGTPGVAVAILDLPAGQGGM